MLQSRILSLSLVNYPKNIAPRSVPTKVPALCGIEELIGARASRAIESNVLGVNRSHQLSTTFRYTSYIVTEVGCLEMQ